MPKTEEVIAEARDVLGAAEMIDPERYRYLVDDLSTIIIQRIKEARITVVQAKWEIGERIAQEFKKGQDNEYKALVHKLASDLKTSSSELYRCVQFYHKFPEWEDFMTKLPEGDNISWNLIKTKYLPDIPTAHIPLILPNVEIDDKWGLIRWWLTHPDRNFQVTLVDKNYEATKLVVRLAKEEGVTPLKEAFKDITDHYIMAKKWSEGDLDHTDYTRMHKSIKRLLLKSKGDKEKIIKAIDYCNDKLGTEYTWTLETVEKKYAEAVRTRKDYEKYLNKKKR